MNRELRIVSAGDPLAVLRALDEAMSASGPAIMPVPATAAESIGGLTLPDDAPADVVAVIETSGSTSKPKRVMLTSRALRASAAATYERLDQIAAARGIDVSEPFPTRQWLLCLPTHYVAGLQVLVRSLQVGTRPVIDESAHFDVRKFDELASHLEGERRYVSLVPAQLQRLVEAVQSDDYTFVERERISARVGRFDGILVGGQSTPKHVLETARSFGWAVVTTYGASETSGGCVYNGVPLRGVAARVESGEILLGGAVLAAGYVDDPERTAAAFTEIDGKRWYRTSDGGSVTPQYDPAEPLGRSAEQRVAVTGRLDHVIISGGEKVNLDEVERVIRGISGFEDAVAVSVPSVEWGESVAIVVPWRGDTDADLLTLTSDALAGLGRAAKPTLCIRVDEMPRLASGKPDRLAARALAERGHG